MKKTIFIFSIVSICAVSLSAKSVTPASEIPAYYAAVNGTSGASLFSTLTTITNTGFSTLGYDGLYSAYPKTDYTASKELWDMYSDCGTTKQCGNYSKECDCYNREHSIPQSWWGGGTGSIGCDIFHVIPTDGYVNNRRGNDPYGEVSSANYTSKNGSKLGSSVSTISVGKKTICSAAGASVSSPGGTVFEPIDEYKGDLARGYLGVILKWNTSKKLTSAEGDKFFQSTYTANTNWGLTTYGVALLMKWHRQDPVSQKEIDRNNGIQSTQGNRNPFIDYPYLAEYIWGEHAGEKVDMSKLISSSDSRFIPGVSDGSYIYTEPTISTQTTELLFSNVTVGDSVQKTFTVIGYSLKGGISLAVSGKDAALFTVSPSSIAQSVADKEQTITVTYRPKATGTSVAILKLSSKDAADVTISLSGACQASCAIAWLVDGLEYTEGDPTTSVALGSTIAQLPTAPESCSELSEQFVGWSQDDIADSTDLVPQDLFSDASESPVVKSDVDFHAVFAHVSQTGGGSDSTIIFSKGATNTGWTNNKTKSSSDYLILVTDASVTSPEIDLSLLKSIKIHMRTYGGTKYKTIHVKAGTSEIASLDATNNTLTDYTWQNKSELKGNSTLVFTGSEADASHGPAFSTITIALEGTKYVYSRFVTKCSFTPATTLYTIHHTSYTKFLRDGRLYINVNGIIYNINGQIVK